MNQDAPRAERPISPWADSAAATSPDGALIAVIDEAREIAMGAPTSGELRISNGMARDGCNPSIVWSDCSSFLAVPWWTRERRQRLMVISVARRSSRCFAGEFRVLELHSFVDGVIEGVDSPVHVPRRFRLDVTELEW